MARVKTLVADTFEWKNFSQPTVRMLRRVGRDYRFHPLCIEDCMIGNQRPKIDEYDNYLFIVLHIPRVNSSGRLTIEEIDIFVGQDFFITIHDGIDQVDDVFKKLSRNKDKQETWMGKGTGYFLYEFVDELFSDMFKVIDLLSLRATRAEKQLFDDPGQEDMLTKILFLRKDLISVSRAIIPQRSVIAQLEHKKTRFLTENLEVYFEDVVDKVERLYINVESLKEVVNLLQQTNESMISHSSNNTIRILTIFSVLMLPLTLVTGIYGMNLSVLPYADHPLSFAIVALVMVMIAATMLSYFRYKRWF
jgi:magnesium transporter